MLVFVCGTAVPIADVSFRVKATHRVSVLLYRNPSPCRDVKKHEKAEPSGGRESVNGNAALNLKNGVCCIFRHPLVFLPSLDLPLSLFSGYSRMTCFCNFLLPEINTVRMTSMFQV
jgi:hypothetical protein